MVQVPRYGSVHHQGQVAGSGIARGGAGSLRSGWKCLIEDPCTEGNRTEAITAGHFSTNPYALLHSELGLARLGWSGLDRESFPLLYFGDMEVVSRFCKHVIREAYNNLMHIKFCLLQGVGQKYVVSTCESHLGGSNKLIWGLFHVPLLPGPEQGVKIPYSTCMCAA